MNLTSPFLGKEMRGRKEVSKWGKQWRTGSCQLRSACMSHDSVKCVMYIMYSQLQKEWLHFCSICSTDITKTRNKPDLWTRRQIRKEVDVWVKFNERLCEEQACFVIVDCNCLFNFCLVITSG